MVPTVEFPPAVPFTDQVTAVLVVPVTAALNCSVCITCTLPLVGEIETVTGGGVAVMLTLALALLLVSATLCALTVTVEGDGTAVGAVYRPAEETLPTVGFPPAVPFTSHVTAVLVVPVTVALNCCVNPTCSAAT